MPARPDILCGPSPTRHGPGSWKQAGGFTTIQLWLTLASKAALPALSLASTRCNARRSGRLGRYGAAAYAVAYLYFTDTVIYALAHGMPDFTALNQALSPAMSVFGAVMVAAGIAFGAATYYARVLPGWTGPASPWGRPRGRHARPACRRRAAIGVRDLAFIGMGIAALSSGSGQTTSDCAASAPFLACRLPATGRRQRRARQASAAAGPDGIDLYRLPLGADGRSVRWCGKFYEALAAWHEQPSGEAEE
jgi:hypothetical protein